jgi:hypothetical protein
MKRRTIQMTDYAVVSRNARTLPQILTLYGSRQEALSHRQKGESLVKVSTVVEKVPVRTAVQSTTA